MADGICPGSAHTFGGWMLYAVTMATERQTSRSPSYSLRAVKRTQAQLEAAQKKADAAMAKAREEGWSFRDIAEAADCAHATVRSRLANYDAAEKKAGKSDA